MSPMKIIFLFYMIISSSKCFNINSYMEELLKKYLQNYVSNRDLVNMIEKVRYTIKHDFPDNFKKNKEAFKGHAFTIRRN